MNISLKKRLENAENASKRGQIGNMTPGEIRAISELIKHYRDGSEVSEESRDILFACFKTDDWNDILDVMRKVDEQLDAECR